MADLVTIGIGFNDFIISLLLTTSILLLISLILRKRLILRFYVILALVSIGSVFSLTLISDISSKNNQVLLFTIYNGVLIVLCLIYLNRQIIRPLRKLEKRTKQMAQGDLVGDVDREISGMGEAGTLAVSTNELNRRFKTMIASIKGSSEDLTNAAELLAAGSEEVSATTHEVTSTIQTIAEGAAEQVRKLDDVSRILTEMVGVIDDSMREIGQTSTITLDLSEQTNLVALNASIEAAKAGEFGEGFNVVADHVRQLSIESKSAANSVNQIIKTISNRIQDSVNTIVLAVDQVASVAENTAASSQEAAAAAEEQSASLQEITEQAQKLTKLSDNTQREISEFTVV